MYYFKKKKYDVCYYLRMASLLKKNNDQIIIYQDFLASYQKKKDQQREQGEKSKTDGGDDGLEDGSSYDISNAFFELANAPAIGYRLAALPSSSSSPSEEGDETSPTESRSNEAATILTIHQDTVSACLQHTGGIVWETSYLLLQYLLDRSKSTTVKRSLGRTIEVGAGCGLLGQALYAHNLCQDDVMVMTETEPVLTNLKSNIDRNRSVLLGRASLNKAIRKKMKKKKKKKRRRTEDNDGASANGNCCSLDCCSLDWLNYQRDMELNPHIFSKKFDTILGTDVVFKPSLVEPLLQTLDALSHISTAVYLCLQVRCPTSHGLLLEHATLSKYNFQIEDITESELSKIPSCQWGLDLECHLYRLTRTHTT